MTQRIFDMDNPQDVKDLFNILPDKITKIVDNLNVFSCYDKDENYIYSSQIISINWRDKTEITRPVDESQWIGKLCWFQEEKDTMPFIGVLESITGDKYKCEAHLTPCKVCRPVRRDEIKFVEDEK